MRGPTPLQSQAKWVYACLLSWLAAIAQPVEHIIRNDGVGGSNPSCGTTPSKPPESSPRRPPQ